jgi:hypothetical protein
MQASQPDWQVLREEITAQAIAACRKFEERTGQRDRTAAA